MTPTVLDVNVLVSGLPARDETLAQIVEHWAVGTFDLLVSEHILAGVERAWSKPYWRHRFPRPLALQALGLLQSEATLVVPASDVDGVADDEEDDLILATAVAGGATYLGTGDTGLLVLGSYRGIVILSPRVFPDLLDQALPGVR